MKVTPGLVDEFLGMTVTPEPNAGATRDMVSARTSRIRGFLVLVIPQDLILLTRHVVNGEL